MESNVIKSYDLKRINKLINTIIWIFAVLMAGQRVIQTKTISISAIIIMIIPLISTYVIKSKAINGTAQAVILTLLPSLPCIFIPAWEGGSETFFVVVIGSTVVSGLFFNAKAHVIYWAIINVLIVGIYIISPTSLIGDSITGFIFGKSL